MIKNKILIILLMQFNLFLNALSMEETRQGMKRLKEEDIETPNEQHMYNYNLINIEK